MKTILLAGFIAISGIYYSQVNLTSDLKLCLPFDGNANDKSGAANHGAVSGATLTTDRFGNPNSAYQFNGTSDYISISNFANLAPTNEITISMWAKCDQITSNCLFMLSPDNPSDRCVGCAQYAASPTMMIWDYGNISNSGRAVASGIPSDLINWHHYVYVLSQSGNLKKIYLDGVSKYTGSYGDVCVNKNLPFYIGAGTDGGAGGSIRFHGKIDDVCIYNRALNANEVSALYTGTGVCFTVGIEELTSFSNSIFYPTISETGQFNYSGDIKELSKIEVFDIQGKLIKSISQQDIQGSNTLDMRDLSKGIYIVKVNKEGKYYSQKLVIN